MINRIASRDSATLTGDAVGDKTLASDSGLILGLRLDILGNTTRVRTGMRCPRCRAANLDGAEVCAECGTLFQTEEQIPGPPTATLPPPVKDIDPGAVIGGKYRLIERLGEGGMGTVFLAEQTSPVQRSVAVKIIKLGMDTKEVVARFESERQALAVMNHPHIARVFDGGATESGRPYFVMELVRGVPITEYCDKHRLSTRERLELIIPVCQAVQHAHQKGVIHRDLKPSNILVTIQDGGPTPKIIDFGIAKATDRRLTQHTLFTEQGKLIGTPEYMSPEQAEMSGLDVDARTDIYSLGVVLYELLTGTLPFDRKALRSGSSGEIQRLIRETDPPRASARLSALGGATSALAECRRTDPRSLCKQLRGDLDWIILKAMEKDRTKRYETANALAVDIQRHLGHEPILAHPPSRSYRLRKLVTRHKAAVASATAVFVLLAAFAATMAIQSARIAAERNKAVLEKAKADAINDFLLETLGTANPIEGARRDVTILEALQSAAEKIDSSFTGQPEIAAHLKETIGTTYLRLGYYEEAEPLLRASVKMCETLFGRDSPEILDPLSALAILRQERGDLAEAEAFTRRGLEIKIRQAGEENADTANLMNNLAVLLEEKGDLIEAERLYRRILEIDRRLHGDHDLSVAVDLNNLGNLLGKQGDFTAGEASLREAVAIFREKKHPWLGPSLGNLGNLLTLKGDPAAARKLFEEALPFGLETLGEKNQELAKLRYKYALCLTKLGDYAEAERQLLAGFEVLRNTTSLESYWVQRSVVAFVELYMAWAKPDRAAEFRALIRAKS